MPPRSRRDSIASQVDPGRDTAETARAELDAQVRSGGSYYNAIAPGHINGQQYTAMVIGYLHANPKLYVAAKANQTGFMAALADCARLGLVLGDEYVILHFKNQRTGIPDITGFTTAAGEIELMYRTGRVTAVCAQAVRVSDYFRRGRTLTEPPSFEPGGNTKKGPDGREYDISGFGGDLEARGPLRGVFAYAVLDNGACTEVAYLGVDQIARRRAKAQTDQVWGPPWPGEGPDTEAMWEKSAVHAARKRAPRSAEYVMARLAQEAAIASTPVPRGLAAPPRNGGELDTGDIPAIMPGRAEPGGTVPAPAAGKTPGKTHTAKGQPVDAGTLARVFGQLDVADLPGLLSGLVGRDVTGLDGLTPGELATVAGCLRDAADGAASEKITLARLRAIAKRNTGGGSGE